MAKAPKLATLENPYRDMFGHEITVGAYIVYGAVDGRSGALRAGQVLELTHSKTAEPKLLVKSWSNFKANAVFGRDGAIPSGRQKNVTLAFFDRLIVVPESLVGKRVINDLAGPAYDWSGKLIKGTL